MKRLEFDSKGRLLSIDAKILDFEFKDDKSELQTSSNLRFLQNKKFENVKDSSAWSLYKSGAPLAPLKFSNGKTQEDIVNEISGLVNGGTKVIFLQGVCGTGKSAIALNVARALGRASIVVPIKNLQKQYEQDYMGDKYVLKKNGEMLKIAMITGRENHDSIIMPGVSCASPTLPDTIKITEKNYALIKDYYKENPYIKNNSNPDLKHIKRISIAPANPHWSPILPEAFKLDYMKDAKKKKYLGLEGKEFVFHHRLPGCSYYDQYLAYIDADVIIFNAAKYKIETALGRKPATDIEIVDEADEFLDSLANQTEINLSHLSTALKLLYPESSEAQRTLEELKDLIELEHKNKLALGVNEEEIFELKDTKFRKFLELLGKDSELISEILIDEANYANKALEAFELFWDSLDETFATFRRQDKDLYMNLLSTNLAQKVKNIVSKNKAILFMSGTLHSEQVLKHIFGIDDFKIVKAETINQGAIEIMRTGKEFDCRYSNLSSKNGSRKDYLEALDSCIAKAKRPTLVHVNAFSDLPNEDEKDTLGLKHVVSSESLRSQQIEDKNSSAIKNFKSGNTNLLFSTRASRGIDFPGNMCNSIVFTKYPNPNTKDIFWKILERTHKDHFWDFYRDKAQRELHQRIYRAVRSQDDHVYILSPDTRVLDAVKQLQLESQKSQMKSI